MFNRLYDYLFDNAAAIESNCKQKELMEKLIHFAEDGISDAAFDNWVEHLSDPINNSIISDPVILIGEDELANYKLNKDMEPNEHTNFDLQRYLLTSNKDDIRHSDQSNKSSHDRMKIHIFDRQTIEKFWSIDAGKKKGKHPNFNSDIKHYIIPYPALKEEITVILTMLVYMANDSNGELVDNNKFINHELTIPDSFKCKLTNKLMTYPVKIDNEIVDLFELMKWWVEDPNHKSLNPLTELPIKHIEFQAELYYELKEFAIQPQLALTKQMLAEVSLEASRLVTVDFHSLSDTSHIPIECKCLLSEKIMIHPVTLNQVYTVDLTELKNWWQRNPAYNLKNPITGDVITKIEYNTKLKNIINDHATRRSISGSHDDNATVPTHTYAGGPVGEFAKLRIGFVPFFATKPTFLLNAGLHVIHKRRLTTLNNADTHQNGTRLFRGSRIPLNKSPSRGLLDIIEEDVNAPVPQNTI